MHTRIGGFRAEKVRSAKKKANILLMLALGVLMCDDVMIAVDHQYHRAESVGVLILVPPFVSMDTSEVKDVVAS